MQKDEGKYGKKVFKQGKNYFKNLLLAKGTQWLEQVKCMRPLPGGKNWIEKRSVQNPRGLMWKKTKRQATIFFEGLSPIYRVRFI